MPPASNRDIEIFGAALERNPAERAAYLDEACGSNADLRSRMESLLQAHDRADKFLPNTASEFTLSLNSAPAQTPVTERVGDRIGRYKIRERIGEGGCGVVYVAEQEEPVRRRVALKIIKLGMDTKSVIARFEAERQALAMMDHANIAKVLDAGATEAGRPYFVMELVRGIRITEYCDQHKLSTGARLDLFIKVCQAVQHAHQKGIIHRDLKPSNILVTLHDGVPVPKIIDFGIAKATEGRLTEQTVYTELHQFIGTPAYMSPEQAEMSGLDIDTRSDIYSLGVLLYELLTGGTPFDGIALVKSGLDAMRKTIREIEPARPSTRLSGMEGALLTTMAQRRGAEVPRLVSAIQGDLDWIVMKCLEKDRTRRYESAGGLSADLKRHLENEPVVARPPSTAYRIQKAIRRNRLACAAAAAVVLALGLGVVGSTWQAVRATRAEREQGRLAESEGRQRVEAVANEQNALQAKSEAEAARQRAEALAYASDIGLAQRALAENNLSRARKLLEPYRPLASQTESPSWEWRYLWQQCQGDALFKVGQIKNFIISLAVSDSGRYVAVGGLRDGLSIWDVANPRSAIAVGHVSEGSVITAMAFAPKGPLLAYAAEVGPVTSSAQQSIHLWDSASKSELVNLTIDDVCMGLIFSGDGKSMVALMAKPEHRLTVYSLPDLKVLATQASESKAQPWNPSRTQVFDNGSAVAIAWDQLKVTDVITLKDRWSAKPLLGPGDSPRPIACLAVSPDEKLLISAEAGTAGTVIRAWDPATGKEIGPRLDEVPYSVKSLVFLPDGKSFVSANEDQTLQVWDCADLEHIHPTGLPLRAHSGGVSALAMLKDKKTLISSGIDGAVYAWDAIRPHHESFGGNALIGKGAGFGFASDGKSLLKADDQGHFVSLSAPLFGESVVLLDTGEQSLSHAWTNDARLVLTQPKKGVLKLWDVTRHSLIREIDDFAPDVLARGLAYDGTYAVFYDPTAKLVRKLDLRTFKETGSWAPLDPDGFSQRSCFSANPRFAMSSTYDGNFSLIDLESGRETQHQLDVQNVVGMTFSPDGKYFAASSYLGYACVYETATMHKLGTVGNLNSPIFQMGISRDGQRIVISQSVDGKIEVWDVHTQRELVTLNVPKGNSRRTPIFSPDGEYLIADVAGTTYSWRAPSWQGMEK